MFIFYICFLLPFVRNGFSLIPEETDLNSLSNYETVDLNVNIENWEGQTEDAGFIIFESISRQVLEQICKDPNNIVYISSEDVTIDCKNFNNDKPVERTAEIVKRSADPEVEGSGDDLPSENENAANNTDSEEKEENEKPYEAEENQNVTEKSKIQDTDKPGEDEKHLNVTEKSKDEESDEPAEDQNVIEKSTVNTEENVTERTPKPDKKKVETTAAPIQTTTVKSTTTQNIETTKVKEKENIQQAVTEHGVEAEEVAPRLNEETHIEYKEHENNNQSEDKKEKKVQGKTLLHQNGNNDESDDSVKVDGSTKSATKAGSKDTTILIVLFAAVVVVGALAFGYNFIKKRKQQNRDLERVERASPIKRSLQNLTKSEDGPEKKPLIGDAKEVEMVDMKKESLPLENGTEKAPSEPTVKT